MSKPLTLTGVIAAYDEAREAIRSALDREDELEGYLVEVINDTMELVTSLELGAVSDLRDPPLGIRFIFFPAGDENVGRTLLRALSASEAAAEFLGQVVNTEALLDAARNDSVCKVVQVNWCGDKYEVLVIDKGSR